MFIHTCDICGADLLDLWEHLHGDGRLSEML